MFVPTFFVAFDFSYQDFVYFPLLTVGTLTFETLMPLTSHYRSVGMFRKKSESVVVGVAASASLVMNDDSIFFKSYTRGMVSSQA